MSDDYTVAEYWGIGVAIPLSLAVVSYIGLMMVRAFQQYPKQFTIAILFAIGFYTVPTIIGWCYAKTEAWYNS